jgi:hypothetical protein
VVATFTSQDECYYQSFQPILTLFLNRNIPKGFDIWLFFQNKINFFRVFGNLPKVIQKIIENGAIASSHW